VNYGFSNFTLKKRRGVSQIIGSLIVLAVVASVGSVILFQGLNQINAFSYSLTFNDRAHNEALREDILFEHVKFDPDTNDLILYLANIGSIDSTIASVTVVKIDTQELILGWEEVDPITNPANPTGIILIEDHTIIHLNATLTLGNGSWNSTEYNQTAYKYKISVTTSKGNFFDTVASPYDT
jgi:hypothetical protein